MRQATPVPRLRAGRGGDLRSQRRIYVSPRNTQIIIKKVPRSYNAHAPSPDPDPYQPLHSPPLNQRLTDNQKPKRSPTPPFSSYINKERLIRTFKPKPTHCPVRPEIVDTHLGVAGVSRQHGAAVRQGVTVLSELQRRSRPVGRGQRGEDPRRRWWGGT